MCTGCCFRLKKIIELNFLLEAQKSLLQLLILHLRFTNVKVSEQTKASSKGSQQTKSGRF